MALRPVPPLGRIDSNYLGWRSAGGEKRPALIVELIRSKDPRVRRAGLEAMTVGLPGDEPEKYLVTQKERKDRQLKALRKTLANVAPAR